MSRSNKFALINDEGEFVILSERTTHTGHHVDISTTLNVDKATLFATRYFPPKVRGALESQFKRIAWVPVLEERKVTLLSFGI